MNPGTSVGAHATGSEKRAPVLVVGGLGFIGSNVVRALLADGQRVRVLDLRRHGALELPDEVEFLEGDFSNVATARRALSGSAALIHLATVTTPQSGTSDPVHDVSENLIGTLRLIEACRDIGVRRLVYASSGGTVYGRPERTPTSEEHPERPLNSYGVVKLAVEKYLWMYAQHGLLDPVVLRPSNPFGPGQYPWGTQGIVAVALGALRDGRPFHLWGDGSVVRDYVYVEDIARAFVSALRVAPSGDMVFNVGAGIGRTVDEVLDACRRVSQRDLTVIRTPGRNIDAPANVLDCARAHARLGWRAEVPFEDGLRRTWEWVRGYARPH